MQKKNEIAVESLYSIESIKSFVIQVQVHTHTIIQYIFWIDWDAIAFRHHSMLIFHQFACMKIAILCFISIAIQGRKTKGIQQIHSLNNSIEWIMFQFSLSSSTIKVRAVEIHWKIFSYYVLFFCAVASDIQFYHFLSSLLFKLVQVKGYTVDQLL